MQKPKEQLASAKKFSPGKLIVKFKPSLSEDERNKAHAEFGTELVQQIPELGLQIVSVEPGKEGDCRCRYLHCEDVVFAEPNYLMFPACGPDDPFYDKGTETSAGTQSQWGFQRIHPEPAFDVAERPSTPIRIAVIDSGVDPDHPDLVSRIVDPVNFSTDRPGDYHDESGHGTFVAGIAAAIAGNGIGIAGASLNTADIMPIKAGTAWYELIPVLKAIVYAVSHGAKVIQMSFAGPEYSVSFQHAIELAWKSGAVCVASAGNDANEQVRYPAGYNYVLSVSATNQEDGLAYFSSWGIPVGVAAPGVAILSTAPVYAVPNYRLNYDALSGSSFSAPFVSGVAAMLFAVNPSLTNAEVVQMIQRSARMLPVAGDKKWDPYFGYGLLDAGAALRLAHKPELQEEGEGSFYGMVIDKASGLPVGGAIVTARSGSVRIRAYSTKTNVLTTNKDLYADGMFRLMNIPAGTYGIFIFLDSWNEPKHVLDASIVPGADVYLRLEV